MRDSFQNESSVYFTIVIVLCTAISLLCYALAFIRMRKTRDFYKRWAERRLERNRETHIFECSLGRDDAAHSRLLQLPRDTPDVPASGTPIITKIATSRRAKQTRAWQIFFSLQVFSEELSAIMLYQTIWMVDLR